MLSRIPEMEHVPANVAVAFPLMVTFGVNASASYAAKLTPAFNVRSSVYVPGRMKIVSPEEADVKAEAIVVCVPLDNVLETIHFAGPNVFVDIC